MSSEPKKHTPTTAPLASLLNPDSLPLPPDSLPLPPDPSSLPPAPSSLTPHPQTLLIANRAEIASRIIRTCKKMGIRTVAVFSEVDRYTPFVEEADLAICIGGNTPEDSYLNQEKIIAAVQKAGATMIHPGYGFLAENAAFARKCEANDILFIGPKPEAIEVMGSKAAAKALMEQHGVPVLPGYNGEDQQMEKLEAAAKAIGFPVLLKATAGGGGKGMRIVSAASELQKAITSAKREAASAFGDDQLIIEKYVASGRHIEFQIFGDQHGNAIHILERECSIQRRYQKIIEESPSPIMDDDLRARMGAVAVRVAKALNYDNAGTVEFIYDDQSKEFYFLEVNTRLQVEHPVTEEITGLDLVQMQIEVAQGQPLRIRQEMANGKGYAIECRLYAEDVANGFRPVTGKVQRFEWPMVDGLRVETGVRSGSEISVYYDPMIAKLIVWGESRAIALQKMRYVLSQLICLGTTTNQAFLLSILENPLFQAGNYNTHFIEEEISLGKPYEKWFEKRFYGGIAASLYAWNQREQKRTLLKSLPSGWRNNFYDYQQDIYILDEEELILKYRYQEDQFIFNFEEKERLVKLIASNDSGLRMEVDGVQYYFSVFVDKELYYLHNELFGVLELKLKPRFPELATQSFKGGYEAPMPAQIIEVLVAEKQTVKSGDSLLVLNSMKMESTISAIEDGTIEEIFVQTGDQVKAGELLLKISPTKTSD